MRWNLREKRKRSQSKATRRRTIEAEMSSKEHSWGTIQWLTADYERWREFIAAMQDVSEHTGRWLSDRRLRTRMDGSNVELVILALSSFQNGSEKLDWSISLAIDMTEIITKAQRISSTVLSTVLDKTTKRSINEETFASDYVHLFNSLKLLKVRSVESHKQKGRLKAVSCPCRSVSRK